MEAISVNEKKKFIKFFLNSFQVKRREVTWILNFVLDKPGVLEKVRFTKNASNENRGMIITTTCVDEPVFRYFTGDVMTTDAEKGFHDIRLNQEEPLYIEFRYKGSQNCSRYASVLTSEYKPPYGTKAREITDVIDNLLENIEYEKELEELDGLINKALDEKDKESFYLYADARNKLLGLTPTKKYETVKSK
jgi:uncharacterized protein YpiB (UPF0302 family)